jgi:hypothetical protein
MSRPEYFREAADQRVGLSGKAWSRQPRCSVHRSIFKPAGRGGARAGWEIAARDASSAWNNSGQVFLGYNSLLTIGLRSDGFAGFTPIFINL